MQRAAVVDLDARYALPFGTRVIERDRNCVQIGVDQPRTVVVRNAPARAASVLGGLDGGRTVSEILHNLELADDAGWLPLLDQLLAAGMLLPVVAPEGSRPPMTVGAHLSEERAGLTHRHGQAAAARILQARDDALVVVRGQGEVGISITAHLAAAGIGHLHHDTAARLMPWHAGGALLDGPSAEGPTPSDSATNGSAPAGRPPPDRPAPNDPATGDPAASGPAAGRGGPDDAVARRLADLRSRFPALRLHSPAAHQQPTAVVLIGGAVPDLGLAAGYSRARVPYLAVATGAARVVIGPFVLPGRSTCVMCVHRHRTDADPQWPTVAGQLGAAATRPPAVLAAAAVCLAVGEVLEHIDGVQPPRTVDGTLEWEAGSTAPRRRTWGQHAHCGCRAIPAPDNTGADV